MLGVTVTDEIGYVYETDSTGEYKRTTGLIQKLEDAEITESTKLTPREKSIALLKYDPNFYIHKTVYQLFGDEVYEGIVRYTDKDTETGRTFWMKHLPLLQLRQPTLDAQSFRSFQQPDSGGQTRPLALLRAKLLRAQQAREPHA